MKTVKDVFALYKQQLADVYDPSETEALTLLVLSDLLDKTKGHLKAFPEKEISFEQSECLRNIVNELSSGKPVQYILGHTEFYGLPFNVNSSVLIPRPETEELVHWILEIVKASGNPIKNILDIGTGSGCIPITLKHHLPDAELFGIDISAGALATAQANSELNKAPVNFIEADILNFDNNIQLPKLDIIVSNPPYVTETDKRQMHQNVTDFEPHTALFVPEDNPLLFYKAIVDFAKERLNPNGRLFFEINESFGKETVEILAEKGFKDIEIRKDLPGRDRMIKAIL